MNVFFRLRRLLDPRPDPPGPRFVIGRDYQVDVPFAAYDSRRPFRILAYLERRGLLRRGMLRRPRPVSLRRLQQVHDPRYLRSLEHPDALEAILGASLPPRQHDAFLDFQRLVCGGTLLAARLALARGEVAVNLGGGLHHASRGRGSGFCAFNDVAVAVSHVRDQGFTAPILVVDLDLHDGEGTRAMFADDPTVHTLSIHNTDLGPTDVPGATSVALGSGVDDGTYLAAVQEHVPAAVRAVDPGLVFYLAGSDPGVDDRLGDWRITNEGLLARDRTVLEPLRRDAPTAPIPTVILLAGGYGPTAWRHGAGLCSWLLSGRSDLDIPLELELPVDHYRRLARHMRRPGLSAREEDEQAGDDWGLTEGDLGGAVTPGAGPGADLFLGIYSRLGLERLMEEGGLLANLRRRGYGKLGLEMDLDDPLGHTVRIVTGHHRPRPVIELKLRLAPGEGPAGCGLLVVEWLLVQDVRPESPPSRPLLPGQEHQGLGLLRDMAAVLVVAVEKLGLDGIRFTPSHFHLARLARPLGRFAAPADEGRYRALARAVRGLPLSEAAAAVSGGQVRDQETGAAVAWEPRPMVLPVTERLKSVFRKEDYLAAVDEAMARARYRLAAPEVR